MGQHKSKEEVDPFEVRSLNFKVLVIGASNSGKSTFISNLRTSYQLEYASDEWLLSWVPILQANAIECVQKLLIEGKALGYEFPSRISEEIEAISKLKMDEDGVFNESIATQISSIWHDPVIQKIFEHRKKFEILENCKFYMENVMEFAKTEWKPPKDWVFRAKKKTNGIVVNEIERSGIRFQFADVASSADRKDLEIKFADSKAIIFMIDLARHTTPVESFQQEKIREEFSLFQELCSSSSFHEKSVPFFVVFNKKDIFEKEVGKLLLSEITDSKKKLEHDYLKELRDFMEKLKGEVKEKEIKYWVVSALDQKEVKNCFKEATGVVLHMNKDYIKRTKKSIKKQAETAKKVAKRTEKLGLTGQQQGRSASASKINQPLTPSARKPNKTFPRSSTYSSLSLLPDDFVLTAPGVKTRQPPASPKSASPISPKSSKTERSAPATPASPRTPPSPLTPTTPSPSTPRTVATTITTLPRSNSDLTPEKGEKSFRPSTQGGPRESYLSDVYIF